MNFYNFEKLNKKALNKLSMLHKACLLNAGKLKGEGFTLPLTREVNGKELTCHDLESLFGSYNHWRIDNGLPPLAVKARQWETGNVSPEGDTVAMEVFFISLATEMPSFEEGEIPPEFRKRDGKAEKEKTAANKKAEKEKSATATTSAAAEVKNEEKVLEKSVREFNDDCIDAIIETTTRRLCSIVGVEFTDLNSKQRAAIKDALADHCKMLENGSVI